MFSSTYNQRETVCVSSYRLVSWFIPFDFVDWSQEERKMTAFSLSVIGLCRHKPAVIELFPSSPPPHIFGCTPFQLGSRAAGGGRVLGKRKTPVVGDLSIDSVVVFVVVVVCEVVVLDTTPPLKLGILQTDGGQETYIVCHRSSAMNSTSLDCSSLATVRSLGGGAELEYDLWEGQFTFSQPGHQLQHDNSSLVHFFKSEYHTLINKV